MGNLTSSATRSGNPVEIRDLFRRRRKEKSTSAAAASASAHKYNWDKMNSCPDLDLIRSESRSVVKCREEEEVDPVGLKIYRSYSDLPDSKRSSCSEIPAIEVRVYRRSTEGLAGAGRAQSLPRGMERSLGAASDISNGSDGKPHHPSSVIESRSSRRTSCRSSMASIGYCRVTAEEFPDTTTIVRKTKDFESNFISALIEAYRCLPPLNQLSAISIATRPDRVNQSVSLFQYLESDSIPADLLGNEAAAAAAAADSRNREYVLTVSEARYEAMKRIKRERLTDQRLVTALDVLRDLAEEAAGELGRIFEYQLSLIVEPVAMKMLARHAVDCIMHVVKRRNRILDRNTVVQGVLRGKPRIAEHMPRYISVIIGSKELKWNIYEIFKKPALRKELFAVPHSSAASGGGWGSDGRSSSSTSSSVDASEELAMAYRSWGERFYTSANCEPMTYGYRGQSIEWDFVNGHYRLSSEEETAMNEELSWRYDDFHRLYRPRARLIGCEAVEAFYRFKKYNPSTSLYDFVKQSTRNGVGGGGGTGGGGGGSGINRDEIKLVFRPLRAISRSFDFQELGLDRVDVARIKVDENGTDKTTLMDTAMEVKRGCDELRCRLEEIESVASLLSPGAESPSPLPPPLTETPEEMSTNQLRQDGTYTSSVVMTTDHDSGPVWCIRELCPNTADSDGGPASSTSGAAKSSSSAPPSMADCDTLLLLRKCEDLQTVTDV